MTLNMMIRDMDLAVPHAHDTRRLEVVADGLPLFGGTQLAIDTTLVSTLPCDGSARRGAAHRDGAALVAARRKKERIYPELIGPARARLVVPAGSNDRVLARLHRRLNNRKGSLSATNRKNAEANVRAYDMNLKTIQASDALPDKYSAFDASMKKVTSDHEEGDVLYAVATEVTDGLQRAQKAPNELDCSCEDVATAARAFSNCWAAHEAATVQTTSAAIDVLPTSRSAWRFGKRGKEHTSYRGRQGANNTLLHRTCQG